MCYSMEVMTQRRGLNGFQIKLIMAFLMVLNHLEFGYNFVSDDLAHVFLIISRCVAPMFAYLAIEGIIYTRNLKRYCLRLVMWTILVLAGNKLLTYLLIHFSSTIVESNYIYLKIRTFICPTIAAGVLCISFIIWSKDNKGIVRSLFLMMSAICFIIGFWSEWGVVLLPFMLITYFLRKKKGERFLGYIAVEIIAILLRSEIYYFFVFPFIALYNGERGLNNKFGKYFFYVFYPLHLWIIAFINFIILSR